MSYEIKKDWTTAAGLRAVVIIVLRGERKSHRCGYVGIPASHPLHGVGYNAAPDLNVHGGVTYADKDAAYPAPNDGLWWYGFDCAHAGDAYIDPVPGIPQFGNVVRSLEYCVDECENLARQIASVSARVTLQDRLRKEAFGYDFILMTEAISMLEECAAALDGVIAVADRKTIEFDRARAVLAKLRGET